PAALPGPLGLQGAAHRRRRGRGQLRHSWHAYLRRLAARTQGNAGRTAAGDGEQGKVARTFFSPLGKGGSGGLLRCKALRERPPLPPLPKGGNNPRAQTLFGNARLETPFRFSGRARLEFVLLCLSGARARETEFRGRAFPNRVWERERGACVPERSLGTREKSRPCH